MGGALSAGAVAGEQPIRRLVGDLLTAAVEEEGEEEGEEEEEAEDGMEESADEDEDDTAERMDDCGEAPLTPPEGFVFAPCPLLTTEAEQRALIGRKILAAHILDGATGWYQGMIQCFDPLGAACLGLASRFLSSIGKSGKSPAGDFYLLISKTQSLTVHMS